jgi:hypothetical protein
MLCSKNIGVVGGRTTANGGQPQEEDECKKVVDKRKIVKGTFRSPHEAPLMR